MFDAAVSFGLPTGIVVLMLTMNGFRRILNDNIDHFQKRTISSGLIGMVVAALFVTYAVGGVRSHSLIFTVLLGLASSSPWLFNKISTYDPSP